MQVHKKITALKSAVIFLAGLEGLEPPNAGIRIRCLTNLAIAQYLLPDYNTKKQGECQEIFKKSLVFLLIFLSVAFCSIHIVLELYVI